MEGFFGIFSFKDPVDVKPLHDMALVLGQGSKEGIITDRQFGMGMHRMPLIKQTQSTIPMQTADGSIYIGLNGEILNYSELKRDLEKRGYNFGTDSDGELVANLYLDKGDDFLQELNGLFSIVIWDRKSQEVTLALDRYAGLRQLYYLQMPDRFIFATNIRLILASGYITPEVDDDGLVEFFSIGRVLPPRCLFKTIKKLIPGHILKCRKNEVSYRRVYGFSFSPKIQQESYHLIDSLFAESIRKNLVADQSPAFLLSGGLDSSLNVAMASRVYDRPVTTVSLGFGDDIYDESSHARIVADYFKADHHVHILDSSDALEILPQLVWCEEEPISDTSSVPSYHLAGFAKKLADVVIAGDGPDHLWGRKYFMLQRFRLARLLLVPQIFRKLITSLAPVRFSSSYPVKVIQRLGQYTNKTVEEMYLEILACELGNPPSLRFLPELLSRSIKNWWDNVSSIKGLIPDDIRDDFDRLVAFDFLVDGSFGVFTKFGKIAAEQSLGVREPYLDNQLVDFITHLPDKFRVRGSLRQRMMFSAETKYLMRRNLADKMLPGESLQKPKAGFTPPMTGWLREYFSRGNMNAEILLGKSLKQSGYFNIEYVEQLINKCQDGSRQDSGPLYMLLMFALWYRIYINNSGTSKPSATLTELISDQT